VTLQSGGGVHRVQGNYIGTDASGTLDVGNGTDGIGHNVRSNDIIGGSNPGEGNLISGNDSDGISIGNSNSISVQGNMIGTQADGVSPLGNGAHGIFFLATGRDCNIGAGAANVIAYNGGDGIFNSSGSGNLIRRNSIYLNGGLGIDLGPNGVTLNDPLDADTGPNNLQNFPELTSAINSGSSVSFEGSLNSAVNSEFTIDFYAVETCDGSANGEGQIFLGSTTVMTDGAGDAAFISPTLTVNIPINYRFTATATDSNGNTSEFSACSAAPPTAAGVSISGRVKTGCDQIVSQATVILSGQDGQIRTALANQFGFYHFADVPAGEFYVISIRHKTYDFTPLFIFPLNDLTDFDLIVQCFGGQVDI
jgi:hypothetical protein